MKSRMAGLETINNGSIVNKAIGQCPEVTIFLGGKKIECLVDTGAQVSTITESFFRQHFAEEKDLVDVSMVIRITGSHGLDIPYLGYLELSMTVGEQEFPDMGFLVVRDPVDPAMQHHKLKVPGVIGSNILRDLKRQHVKDGKEIRDPILKPALALYGEVRNHNSVPDVFGRVRIASKKPILVPACSLKVVEATVCSAKRGETYSAIVEEAACFSGPRGFAMAPAMVQVDDNG